MQIIDTNGKERYRSGLRFIYQKANGILIIYDISKKESFNNLYKYFDEINLYANEQSKICKILIGNKTDILDRAIDEEEGKKVAKEKNMAFFEVSAKDNQNINQVFNFIVNKILRYELNKYWISIYT